MLESMVAWKWRNSFDSEVQPGRGSIALALNLKSLTVFGIFEGVAWIPERVRENGVRPMNVQNLQNNR